MKSKRRHELQTNVLADWTGNKIKAIQPYSNWIIGGVIAVLAVVVLLLIRADRQKSSLEEGWARFEAASAKGFDGITSDEPLDLTNAVKELESVALEYEGATLFTYTQLTLGDLHLRSGQTKYRANRPAARDHFKSASRHYEAAIDKSDNEGLKNRATYSLAKSYEWQMKLGKAKETYAKVEGAYATEAQMRVRDLNRPGTRSFYDHYAKWKPKEKASAPGDRYPAPGFELDPEDSPADGEIDIGSFLDDTAAGTDTVDPDGPSVEDSSEDGADPSTTEGGADTGDADTGDADTGDADKGDTGEGETSEGDAGEADAGDPGATEPSESGETNSGEGAETESDDSAAVESPAGADVSKPTDAAPSEK